MLANYAQLQDAIIATLWDRSDLSGRVPDWIVEAEEHFNNTLRVAQMEDVATITITAGTGPLPTDYLAWRRVYANSSPVRVLDYFEPNYAIDTYPDTAAGLASGFTIIGTNIVTKPPSSSTLNMQYYKKIPALAANTSGNWLLTRSPSAYKYGALVHAASFLDDAGRMVEWGALRDQAISGLISSDNNSRFSRVAARVKGPTP